MTRIAIFAFLFAAMAATQGAAASGCFDLSKGEPQTLTGKLEHKVFAGAPNFEDIRKGDTPEPSYVLTLSKPICITGDDFADAAKFFRDVQLVETELTVGALGGFLNKNVEVTISRQIAAETGHHHEPLVAWVTAVHFARR